MTPYIKTCSNILILLLCLHGVFSIIAYNIYEKDGPAFVREDEASFNLGTLPPHLNISDYLMFYDQALNTKQNKIVFLGASNVREGLLGYEAPNYFPDTPIYMFLQGAANISSMQNVVEMVFDRTEPNKHNKLLFIYGIWLGSFNDNATREQDGATAQIETTRTRYGLYKKQNGKVVAAISPELMPIAGLALLPNRFITYVSENAYHFFSRLASKVDRGTKVNQFSEEYKNAIIFSEAQKSDAIKKYNIHHGGRGTLRNEQFEYLEKLAEKISAHGAKLLLVDLPIPRWHKDRSSYFADYQTRKKDYFSRIWKIPNVSYLDMQDFDSEADFWDAVHPKPKVTKKWFKRITEHLETTGF